MDGLVERPADESVLRIGRVLDGARYRRPLRHLSGRRRRMHDWIKCRPLKVLQPGKRTTDRRGA